MCGWKCECLKPGQICFTSIYGINVLHCGAIQLLRKWEFSALWQYCSSHLWPRCLSGSSLLDKFWTRDWSAGLECQERSFCNSKSQNTCIRYLKHLWHLHMAGNNLSTYCFQISFCLLLSNNPNDFPDFFLNLFAIIVWVWVFHIELRMLWASLILASKLL